MSTSKILHVAETAKGGVGTYIDEVAALQLAGRADHDVRVVLPDAHAAQFQRLPATAQRHFKAGVSRFVNTWRMVGAAFEQIREWQPDVVHLHSTFAGFALRPLIGMLASRPRVVYCAHGWAFDREGSAIANRVFKWIERLWSHWGDRVVCVSAHELAAGAQIGIARERLVLVNNGVRDTLEPIDASAAMSAWPPGRRRVLFVGRLDRQKGVDVLFEAMNGLQDQAFAVVIGSAVVASDRRVEQPANVHVAGWLSRDEISAYYAAAEVVVIPSRWEAFSLVAVEAMRAGRAVLGSSVGGLRDVVADGLTGHLFEPGDAAGLTALIRSLSSADIAALGAAGRERYDRYFRIERVAEELDGVYRSVLAERDALASGLATGASLDA
ncbi:MAG TPA: glycosyltransferase [Burkholderiaceae bacterium]|jgi:glycosyltransferase involved in cell wall biosynthesis